MNQMKKEKGAVLTCVGMLLMVLLTATKIMPSSTLAGYSVFVGIAFFFIVETVSKTSKEESGLRFHTIGADLKKTGILYWAILPLISVLLTTIVGTILFDRAFVDHIVGRTSAMLSFDKIPLLVIQVVIAAWGEEIAFRGFFVGKSMKYFPFWICAIVSSIFFAAGHIAVGNVPLVIFDIATIFIDSIIFAVVYSKSGNCMISTISHILGNSVAILITFIFFL